MTGRENGRGGITFQAPCTHPRPAAERHYYHRFKSVADAAYLYVDNILNSGYYSRSAAHVKRAFRNKRMPNINYIINGLGAYAGDSGYRESLKEMIRHNDLTRYDKMVSCN